MRILFLCTGNAARSQMAEGWARHLLPRGWESHSAGTHPSGLHPFATKAMKERGIELGGQYSKGLDEVPDTADVLVTLCSHAAELCPRYPGAERVEHWNLPDPVMTPGSNEVVMSSFREVRDVIEQKMQILAKELSDVGRSTT